MGPSGPLISQSSIFATALFPCFPGSSGRLCRSFSEWFIFRVVHIQHVSDGGVRSHSRSLSRFPDVLQVGVSIRPTMSMRLSLAKAIADSRLSNVWLRSPRQLEGWFLIVAT